MSPVHFISFIVFIMILQMKSSVPFEVISDQKEVENIVIETLKHKFDGVPQFADEKAQQGVSRTLMKLLRSHLQVILGVCGMSFVTKKYYCILAAEDGERFVWKTSSTLEYICHERKIHFTSEQKFGSLNDTTLPMYNCPIIENQTDKIYYLGRIDERLDQMVVYVHEKETDLIIPHRIIRGITFEELVELLRIQEEQEEKQRNSKAGIMAITTKNINPTV